MNNLPILAVIFLALAGAGCQFENTSKLLVPTSPGGPSGTTGTTGTSGTSGTPGTSGTSGAPSGFSGTWGSSSVAGLPLGECSNVKWLITDQSTTAIAGTLTASCHSGATVAATLSGQMTSATTLALAAAGTISMAGIPCNVNLSGTGDPTIGRFDEARLLGHLLPWQSEWQRNAAPLSRSPVDGAADRIADVNLQGIFPPIPTPFLGEGIDRAGLAGNVQRWMGTRLAGLVVLGSNGEAPLLDEVESDAVIDIARTHMPRDRTLIAGVGRESTPATIAAAKRAAGLGADCVLVRTPSFYKNVMTTEAFVRHYTAVADACPVPMLLYNVTMFTGVNLLPDAVARLSSHPNVIGVKESNSDLVQLSETIARAPEGFVILSGSAATLCHAFHAGATGAVVALAAALPDACVDIFDLVKTARHAEALTVQRRIAGLGRLLGAQGVAGLKMALELAGYVGGPTRPPLGSVPADARDAIGREWERAYGDSRYSAASLAT
jgi:4-hydroxy-2-oxoglutarate aldolase